MPASPSEQHSCPFFSLFVSMQFHTTEWLKCHIVGYVMYIYTPKRSLRKISAAFLYDVLKDIFERFTNKLCPLLLTLYMYWSISISFSWYSFVAHYNNLYIDTFRFYSILFLRFDDRKSSCRPDDTVCSSLWNRCAFDATHVYCEAKMNSKYNSSCVSVFFVAQF